jgi:hypothetical protein
MKKGSASCFHYPKLLAHAIARKKWTFLDKGAPGFREIALWGSSRPCVVFERGSPIGGMLTPFLHRRQPEGFTAIDRLQFGRDALRG